MSAKNTSKDLVWFVGTAVGIVIAFFASIYLRGSGDPAAQIALKEQRIAQVNAMRLSLAAASEAQNSAVLSTGEQDAKTFAEEARSATAELERRRLELMKLQPRHPSPHEIELLDRVSQSFREFQKIDEQLLELALESSNRKAFGLAFGPAMRLLSDMDEPLSRIIAMASDQPGTDALRVTRLAGEVRVGILRIQVLLLPHIAEASDPKMDEFERELTAIDQSVQENIRSLSPLLTEAQKSRLDSMTSHYAEFELLKAQIITLSRQNTNVRAAAIVLQGKRKAMLACQDALVELERAIQAEPISSMIPSGRSPQ